MMLGKNLRYARTHRAGSANCYLLNVIHVSVFQKIRFE
jgi:hypothetical protein